MRGRALTAQVLLGVQRKGALIEYRWPLGELPGHISGVWDNDAVNHFYKV